jgi:hypothetical protein
MSFFWPRTSFGGPFKGRQRIGLICWWVGCCALAICITRGLIESGALSLEMQGQTEVILSDDLQPTIIFHSWWAILVKWWLLGIVFWLAGRALLALITRGLIDAQTKQQIETF